MRREEEAVQKPYVGPFWVAVSSLGYSRMDALSLSNDAATSSALLLPDKPFSTSCGTKVCTVCEAIQSRIFTASPPPKKHKRYPHETLLHDRCGGPVARQPCLRRPAARTRPHRRCQARYRHHECRPLYQPIFRIQLSRARTMDRQSHPALAARAAFLSIAQRASGDEWRQHPVHGHSG